jgi:hypothetical protein
MWSSTLRNDPDQYSHTRIGFSLFSAKDTKATGFRPVFRRGRGSVAWRAAKLRFLAVRTDAPPIRRGPRADF